MTFSNRDQIKRLVNQGEGHLEQFRACMTLIHEIYDNAGSQFGTDYSERDHVVFQMVEFSDLLSGMLEKYRQEMV